MIKNFSNQNSKDLEKNFVTYDIIINNNTKILLINPKKSRNKFHKNLPSIYFHEIEKFEQITKATLEMYDL